MSNLDPSLQEWLKRTPLPAVPRDPPPDSRRFLKGVMGVDSMSPYTLPSSQTVFKSIADVVNNKGFPAIYPQSYTPIPEYYRKYGITPYFNPGEGEDYAKGSLTVAGMIELTVNGQPWALQRDQDLELVRIIAERYYASIEPFTKDNIQIKAYAANVQLFLKTVRKGLDRLAKRTGKSLPSDNDLFRILGKMLVKS